MLDNLIIAYRVNIYDWNLSRWASFIKDNKPLAIRFGVFVLLFGISFAIYLKFPYSLFWQLVLLGEIAVIVLSDRYTVKQYQKFLLGRQKHLDETVNFLKTVLPEKNLFSMEHVEELIERLTKRIETQAPFRIIRTSLTNFVKGIVLPVITYIAGVYSVDLKQYDFTIVISQALFILILLGVFSLLLNGMFVFARLITCRDYDAAIAFREDLLDIRLLHFS